MDNVGAVVVLAAGNGGYDKVTGKPSYYQAERTPVNLATNDSPYIVVGATYHDGSIAEFTTPPGAPDDDSNTNDLSISIWAQGVNVYTCNPMDNNDPMGFRAGTSYAAPQVVSLPTPPYPMRFPSQSCSSPHPRACECNLIANGHALPRPALLLTCFHIHGPRIRNLSTRKRMMFRLLVGA
jgi:hypothetical protein